jgi:hypothetical protein
MTSHIFCQSKNTACSTPTTCQQACKARRQFQPDYGIEHTRVEHRLTLLGWIITMYAIAALVFIVFL